MEYKSSVGVYQFGATVEARRAVRRAIQLDCAVYAEAWDEPLVHRASNLSERGLWIETDLLLNLGTEVSVVFSLSDWPDPIYAAGRIQRVLLRRRSDDPRRAGMGVAFEGLRADERRRLTRSLAALSAVRSHCPHERTLIGIPAAAESAGIDQGLSETRTIIGWAAPAPASKAQLKPRREPHMYPDAQREASASSAFGGGLGLASSVFRPSPPLGD